MNFNGDFALWLQSPGYLIWPLLLALWLAVGDVRTHSIPNYLNLLIALSGFGYQIGFAGLSGAGQALMGLCLGFGLLIIPYLLGGMGAGDVKALAALGAWLGPWQTFLLFFYIAVAGGLISLALLCWKGLFWSTLRRGWIALMNWILRRPFKEPGSPQIINKESETIQSIPYGVAIALGMATLYVRGPVL